MKQVALKQRVGRRSLGIVEETENTDDLSWLLPSVAHQHWISRCWITICNSSLNTWINLFVFIFCWRIITEFSLSNFMKSNYLLWNSAYRMFGGNASWSALPLLPAVLTKIWLGIGLRMKIDDTSATAVRGNAWSRHSNRFNILSYLMGKMDAVNKLKLWELISIFFRQSSFFTFVWCMMQIAESDAQRVGIVTLDLWGKSFRRRVGVECNRFQNTSRCFFNKVHFFTFLIFWCECMSKWGLKWQSKVYHQHSDGVSKHLVEENVVRIN